MQSTLDAMAFRQVMGLFATGVTVVATQIGEEIHGMTANAFASVSLDPPLVLVCVNRPAHMARNLHESGRFSVNFLEQGQEDLSRHFARATGATPDFEFEPWAGTIRLVGCLGSVACEVERVYDGGDHEIFLARVLNVEQESREGDPLVFWKGRYRRIDSTRE